MNNILYHFTVYLTLSFVQSSGVLKNIVDPRISKIVTIHDCNIE